MRSLARAILLVVTFAFSVAAQHWLDAESREIAAEEESLYVPSAEALRRASLGFTGLFADVYWMRTSIYFGAKFDQQRQTGDAFDTGQLRLLKPMLDIVTELDPHHVAAYSFGGFFLPGEEGQEAVRFLERGIRDNPNEWRLYQDLGFARWRQGKFKEAAAAYLRGSRITGAPAWMGPIAAMMIAKGGDRETARQIFQRLHDESDDVFVKQICEEQLRRLRFQADHQPPITNH
ncbi:MAG: hypothetical protein M3X11_00680 [Acidobacteriota bacterium]|nr:hypothetical protein [Acidobacteriota bacterium]